MQLIKLSVFPIFVAVLFLSGCDFNGKTKAEKAHIENYMQQVKQLTDVHAEQIKASKALQDIEQLQYTTLEELQKIKQDFAQYHSFAELQGIITTVDYALSHILQSNQKIFEHSSPLWKDGKERLIKFKEPEYVALHKASMESLYDLMDDFDDKLREHNEQTRLTMLNTGLSEDYRAVIWPQLLTLNNRHIQLYKPVMAHLKLSAENELRLAEFLHENKDNYTYIEGKGLEFNDYWLASRYNSMVSSMQHSHDNLKILY